MPQTPHVERHFTAGEVVRDVVIGMSDGLTVPFALAAGLSGAVDNSHIVVVAGLAEIAAGSIAMGLGGYLAARGDAEHYESERQRETREVEEIPDEEAREVQQVFTSYGLSREESGIVVQSLTKRPKQWVDFMMRFELGLEEPDPTRAVQAPPPSPPPTSLEASSRSLRTCSCIARARPSSGRCWSRYWPWQSSATSKADSPAPGRCAQACRPWLSAVWRRERHSCWRRHSRSPGNPAFRRGCANEVLAVGVSPRGRA